jgi:hypothetical protein
MLGEGPVAFQYWMALISGPRLPSEICFRSSLRNVSIKSRREQRLHLRRKPTTTSDVNSADHRAISCGSAARSSTKKVSWQVSGTPGVGILRRAGHGRQERRSMPTSGGRVLVLGGGPERRAESLRASRLKPLPQFAAEAAPTKGWADGDGAGIMRGLIPE